MFNSLVWNLLLTGVLAIVLVGAGRLSLLRRRPALRHTLWLLLLAKLVTPPLIHVPLLPSTVQAPPAVDDEATTTAAVVAEGSGSAIPDGFSRGAPPPDAVDAASQEAWARIHGKTPGRWHWSYFHILSALSVIGTFLLVTTHTVLAVRMERWLHRFGAPAPILDRTCREVAASLGIRKSVRACVVDARIVPLLWGWCRPMIVVPRQLVENWDVESLRCIVAHELAHYARRDQWSNLFALWIKAILWWYPVTWWAHREIRAAQESCCDALAMEHVNTTRKGYATTLLQALDFVRPESNSHWRLAIQMGSSNSILRRFEMIGNTHLTYHVSRWTFLTLCVFMIPLFCLPVRSQEKKKPQVAKIIDQSLSIDETSTNPLAAHDETARKEVQIAGKPEHLFLVGIVWRAKPAETAVTPTAWVSDRTSKKQITIETKSTCRVGATQFTVESMMRDSVNIRIDDKLFRWKLGKNFREVIDGQPADVSLDVDGTANSAVKGELAGGGLSPGFL